MRLVLAPRLSSSASELVLTLRSSRRRLHRQALDRGPRPRQCAPLSPARLNAHALTSSLSALAANGKTVFLSDGLKKSYDDVEYYYEEFCYKKVKARQRSNDGASTLALLPLPPSPR